MYLNTRLKNRNRNYKELYEKCLLIKHVQYSIGRVVRIHTINSENYFEDLNKG